MSSADMVAGDPPAWTPVPLSAGEHAAADLGRSGGFSWLTALGFAFLTFNSGMAIYRSYGDMAAVAFVAFSYADLVALFYCLRCYETAEPRSNRRENLKVALWVLTTLLVLLFSYKVAAVLPIPVRILVWVVAGSAILGGFYAFFILRDKEGTEWGSDNVATSRFFAFAFHIKDAVAAVLFSNGRFRIRPDRVLAALRRHLPDRNRAHEARDVAWSSVRRLILDSGASRHAVGDMWLLEGFQSYIPPFSARLADGRYVQILGNGRIEMGNFYIPDVDLVEGVQDGLISIPQLDREHGLVSCFGNGVCRIMRPDGTEVGGALLEEDGMYELRFLEVPAGPSSQEV